MDQKAKIVEVADGQMVHLPLEFCFDAQEVFIRRDAASGDVVLSCRPTDWKGLLDAVALNKDEDFSIERRLAASRRDKSEMS